MSLMVPLGEQQLTTCVFAHDLVNINGNGRRSGRFPITSSKTRLPFNNAHTSDLRIIETEP